VSTIKNIRSTPVNPKSEVAIRRSMQKVNRLGKILTRLVKKVRGVDPTT
jgi:hypothetical protein